MSLIDCMWLQGRLIVSTVLVRSPLTAEPLEQIWEGSSAEIDATIANTGGLSSGPSELGSELSELDGEPEGNEPGSVGAALSMAQAMIARTGGADAVAAIASNPDFADSDIADIVAQVLQQTSSPVETDAGDEEAAFAGPGESVDPEPANPEQDEVTWMIAHEDVQVYGAVPSIPTQQLPLLPSPENALLNGRQGKGLQSFLGGVAETVLERRVNT